MAERELSPQSARLGFHVMNTRGHPLDSPDDHNDDDDGDDGADDADRSYVMEVSTGKQLLQQQAD